jgi:hypothetical protein
VDGGTAMGNTIRGNSMYSNGGKAIEDINGGNSELARPLIDSVGSASGHAVPKCYPCTVEIFSDDDGEGRIYHGSATTNDVATGTWSYLGSVVGPNITATITDASGNTSEFSAPVPYSPPDTDGDGCTDAQELAMGFNPNAWYDFYDVPQPSRADPAPNGPRNQAVTLKDVLAVLMYVGTYAGDGGVPNANGVAYDSDKGTDTDGDTVAEVPPDGVPDGQDYDRTPGVAPNPPWEAGPPNGAINLKDVLAALAQVGLDCSGTP